MGKKSNQVKMAPAMQAPEAAATKSSGFFTHPLFPVAVLLAAVAAVYWGSLQNDFVAFDDDKSIWYNPHLKNPTFSGIFGEQLVGMYVPVTSLMYVLVYQFFGEKASYFHVFGLLVHLANVLLVFRFFLRVQPRAWAAFFIALLFGVHPMLVEPVSWVSALSTLLFSCFYLVTLHLFWSYLEEKGRKFFWIALATFILAGLSKSAAATLPVTLVVLDWWKNGHLNGKVIFSRWPFWFVSAGLVVLTFITRTAEGHDIGGSTNTFSLVDRLFMISQTVFFYPFKLLVPSGYSIFYPFVKENGVWRADYYLALPALGLLAWWVVKNWNKHRDIIFGIGMYLAPLFLMLPVVSVGTAEMRNDRYAYLPCLGVFFLLTLLLDKLRSDAGKYAVMGALAAFFAWNTTAQTSVWKDGTALFGNCVDKTPEAALCQCNLGYSELIALSFGKSVEHYSNALELDPSYVEAYNGRGQAYMNLKKIPEAISDFTKAIDAGIVTPKLFGNRGKCYALLSRFEEAIPDLSKSLELEPKSAEIWYFRAFSSEKTGNLTEALNDYTKAVELNPDYVEALVNRGLLHYKDNKYDLAIKDNTRALSIAAAGIKPMILVTRANAYMQSGQLNEALADLNEAVAIDPNYKRAYQSRAAVYQKLGQNAKAAEDLAR